MQRQGLRQGEDGEELKGVTLGLELGVSVKITLCSPYGTVVSQEVERSSNNWKVSGLIPPYP